MPSKETHKETEAQPDVDTDDRVRPMDRPLTSAGLLKWSGVIVTIISGLISLVWFAASMKGDIITLQQELIAQKKEADLHGEEYQKQIDKLVDRADNTDKSITDLDRKLDVAVAILERIDKKVNNAP